MGIYIQLEEAVKEVWIMLDRVDLIGDMKKIVDEWERDINNLEKKTHKVKEMNKEEYDEEIAKLKKQKKEIEEKIKTLEEASEEHVEEHVEKFKKTVDESKGIFKKTLGKAKKLIKRE